MSLPKPTIPSPPLAKPEVMLFDWHGTLVDTHDAMYAAIEEMLPRLEELELIDHITPENQAKSPEDQKLLRYIRIFRHLHPRVLAERRVSRTDVFDVLFDQNEAALAIAHASYNDAYRRHFGKVLPFQPGVLEYLKCLQASGIKIGVVTNRSREFLDYELEFVESGKWQGLFDITICGNEATRYKPEPDSLIEAIHQLKLDRHPETWFIGDSITDMATAQRANITSVFYNGALWEESWFESMFGQTARQHYSPQAIINDFEQLLDLVEASEVHPGAKHLPDKLINRPPRQAPRTPPPPRIEPDWHPAIASLHPPSVILFDWHATLVDTLDAMYHAVDDMLKELREMGLLEHLVHPMQCKSPEDLKLVNHVRDNLELHPKIKLDRKISRTDIFEVLFGDNIEAKKIAHAGFTRHYRTYFGTALPFEPEVREVLEGLQNIGLTLGVITNRDREFFLHEVDAVDEQSWAGFFETSICGDDTEQRKPHTDQIVLACKNLGCPQDQSTWYVGDSTTDVIASKSANITSVFFNGALWDQPWLERIFPGNMRFPHKPDVVVNDFSELWALVLACRAKEQHTTN